jgi:very-short-patch-repair endonuclease
MTHILREINRKLIVERGWQSGSDLEDKAAWVLSQAFKASEVKQQHSVGRYRIDFAWPDVKVALEVDGWHHRSPDGAAHDAQRDAALRAEGWIVLRVDDRNGAEVMHEQIVRVCRVVHGLREIGDPAMIRRMDKEQRGRRDG